MAGDIGIQERILIMPEAQSLGSPPEITTNAENRVVHRYGSRIVVIEASAEKEASALSQGAVEANSEIVQMLTEQERYGYGAFALRESVAYRDAKAARPYDNEAWDNPGRELRCSPPNDETDHELSPAEASAPTSQRLTGSVAVGVVIVEGPTPDLKFSTAERTKVVAEVQNGLGWLATQNPSGVTFKYDIKVVSLSVRPGPDDLDFNAKERRWRDPAMRDLGYGTGMAGVRAYAEANRSALGTDWTFVAFFTKYPVAWFAYASIGGPRLVMHYENDGWGPDNIDRVFAHETGHIFGAPDEYAASGCNCGGSWGYHGRPNANCANCASGGGVDCLMKGNSWRMCVHTPYHLGFPLVEQRYTGVWRQGSDAYYLWANAGWHGFRDKWQDLAQHNLRLVDLKITRQGNADRFHGVWRQGTGAYYLWVNASRLSFIEKWRQLSDRGLRLVDLEVRNIGGRLLYSGVWLPGNDRHYLWLNADWPGFIAKWRELAGRGLRLHDLRIVTVGGRKRYSGIWREGQGGYYLWVNADWRNFSSKWQQLAQRNLRLVDIEITDSNAGLRYSGVWLPGSDGYYLWTGADWQHFVEKWNELAAQGLRLVDLDVVPGSGPQSPLPMAEPSIGGGLADLEADTADGDGGGGDASPGGVIGFGSGSYDGAATQSSEGGLVGEGGGSIDGTTVSDVDDEGMSSTPELQRLAQATETSGGGLIQRAEEEDDVLELDGMGGGTLS